MNYNYEVAWTIPYVPAWVDPCDMDETAEVTVPSLANPEEEVKVFCAARGTSDSTSYEPVYMEFMTDQCEPLLEPAKFGELDVWDDVHELEVATCGVDCAGAIDAARDAGRHREPPRARNGRARAARRSRHDPGDRGAQGAEPLQPRAIRDHHRVYRNASAQAALALDDANVTDFEQYRPHVMGTLAHRAYLSGDTSTGMLDYGPAAVFADAIESAEAIFDRIIDDASASMNRKASAIAEGGLKMRGFVTIRRNPCRTSSDRPNGSGPVASAGTGRLRRGQCARHAASTPMSSTRTSSSLPACWQA